MVVDSAIRYRRDHCVYKSSSASHIAIGQSFEQVAVFAPANIPDAALHTHQVHAVGGVAGQAGLSGCGEGKNGGDCQRQGYTKFAYLLTCLLACLLACLRGELCHFVSLTL